MNKSKIIEELTALETEKRKLLEEIARINHEEWVKDEPVRKERELKRKREQRQELKERKAREKAEAEEKEREAKREEERKEHLKAKIQEQKIVVDRLVEDARQSEAVMVAERSARHDVMARHVAEATAELRGQLAALEAATWERLAREPESIEVDKLSENYRLKLTAATKARESNQALCEFHPKRSRDSVSLDCRCFHLCPRTCRICGAHYETVEGECHCFHN